MVGRIRGLLGGAGVLLVVGLLAATGACFGLGAPSRVALPANAAGVLTYNRQGNVYALPLATQTEQKVTEYPEMTAAIFSARSPDAARLAVVRIEGQGRTLTVTNADRSGNSRQLLNEYTGRTTIAQPQWAPDGKSLVYMLHTYVMEGQLIRDESFRVERIDADGTNRRVIVPAAMDPSLAPDETLAFMRMVDGERQLMIREPGGAERLIVAARGFVNVAAPRFSPDGQTIAFAAAGEGANAGRPPDRALWRLGPAIAHAHGEPWDIWLAQRDGTVRRLTRLGEDEPTMAWSPSGEYLAVSGGNGVHIIDVATGQATRLGPVGGFGGIDWTP